MATARSRRLCRKLTRRNDRRNVLSASRPRTVKSGRVE